MSAAIRDRDASGRVIFFTVVAFAIVWIAPLVWVFVLSIKPNEDLMLGRGSILLPPFTLQNYIHLAETSLVFRWFQNSLIVAGGTTVLVLILSTLAGYGFARVKFPGRDILFVLVLLGLAVPEQAVIIARHQMFTDWGLHNSYTGLILPNLALPFGVFLMTQYFRGISSELEEAAMLDHATRWQIFYKVLLPLTVPAQATLAIFTFLHSWNDFFWPLISATRPEMYTITVGIASVQTNFAQSEGLGYLMAQALVAAVPALVFYLLFQKHIVRAAAGAAIR